MTAILDPPTWISGFSQNFRKAPTLRAEPPFVFFFTEERKGGSAWIASTLWSRRSPNFWTSQSCFLSSNWFFQCEHPFSDKTDGYNWARCTMTNQDGYEICSSCSKPNTSCCRQDSSYSQFTSRVTGIFEIWTAFWNLHVSFEHRQRGFKVPVEVSLVYWRYKALNFSLHYNIKYFKNNNCFPSILNLFFFC